MLNHIDIAGRLTKDPELRQTANGNYVTSFSIAVERDYSTGEEKVTDFFNVVAWQQTAKFVSNYFRKGNMAIISGRLATRTWEKDGQKHTVTEINADNVYFGQAKATHSEEAPAEQKWTAVEDDSLPF